MGGLFGVRKWYLDALPGDGRFLVVYLVELRVAALTWWRLAVSGTSPGQAAAVQASVALRRGRRDRRTGAVKWRHGALTMTADRLELLA